MGILLLIFVNISIQRNIPIENFRKEMPIRWEDQKKLFGIG